MLKSITNHSSLYFSDGNVILLSPESPDHHIAFRVHRSILTKVSPVFEDLFSISTFDEMEMYEGVPFVYVTDGAPAMQRLLELVYHHVYVGP
jgi:hypothetical protein